MLQTSNYTFWTLDTGEQETPQYPSEPGTMSPPGRLRLTRLFPFGRVFLITPSFAISEPKTLCAFLEWFKIYGSNPGYRIVTCHEFPRFLLQIAEEKNQEREQLIETNPDNPHIYDYFERAGRTETDIKLHLEAYQLIYDIMEKFGDTDTSDGRRHSFIPMILPCPSWSFSHAQKDR